MSEQIENLSIVVQEVVTKLESIPAFIEGEHKQRKFMFGLGLILSMLTAFTFCIGATQHYRIKEIEERLNMEIRVIEARHKENIDWRIEQTRINRKLADMLDELSGKIN